MKRLAIISSYNESCGNASYTYALKMGFSKYCEVTVFPLDLFLLQRGYGNFSAKADAHIAGIAAQLKDFDYVNIQFEAGLYGISSADILRRIKMLIDAAPNLIFTMHRIDPPVTNSIKLIYQILRNPRQFRSILQTHINEQFYKLVIEYIKKASLKKNAWIAVHTKREARLLRDVYECKNYFDFPITFLDKETQTRIRTTPRQSVLTETDGADKNTKVIGLFGFISKYKGFETVIQALRYLPDNYVLAIYGSQHPQSIRMNIEIDPYIQDLLKLIEDEEAKVISDALKRSRKYPDALWADQNDPNVTIVKKYSLRNRIKFMGNLPDEEFMMALHNCDAVILPYVEVGQSMSGVVCMALECDARMIVSNNHSFFEFQKYFGKVYEAFDIGNFMELAQRILAPAPDFSKQRADALAKYNLENHIALQMEKFNSNSSSD